MVEHNLKIVNFTLSNLPVQVVHSRITSNLIPLATLKSFNQKKMNYELVLKEKKILSLCQALKETIRKKRLTVSMHPSQFVSLTSKEERIRKNSQAELIYHAKFLDLISEKAVITIHLNSKRELIENLGEEQYLEWTALAINELPSNVLTKIGLENESRGF
ncbi:MAG: hypothetical protein NY202_04195 [Mollicutes bacterium UO1]